LRKEAPRDPETAPAGTAAPAVDTKPPAAAARRWLVRVYSDERDHQIVERVPLEPHESVKTYYGTALMRKVFTDGLVGQRQWNFEVPGATIDEAFDAYDAALEKAKAEADKVMEQEHTRDALSGRLPRAGMPRAPALPPRRIRQ
jgi:hypothetical protein